MPQVTCVVCEIPAPSTSERLAGLLSVEDAARYDELLDFWQAWFGGAIPGEKITLVAETDTGQMVGVVRFWCSPFCDQKWLVEGLEVHPDWRRRGIGEQLLMTGIARLKADGIAVLWSHIGHTNIASMRLHEKVGFRPLSQGYVNSWGDRRDNGSAYCLALSDGPTA